MRVGIDGRKALCTSICVVPLHALVDALVRLLPWAQQHGLATHREYSE